MQSLEGFKVKKRVTVQLFKMKPGADNYYLIDGAMHEGKKIDEDKNAAILMNVTDLVTGEEGQIICPTILQRELTEGYPDDGYVGKKFWWRITRVPGVKYNLVDIAELEAEGEGDGEGEGEKPAPKGRRK